MMQQWCNVVHEYKLHHATFAQMSAFCIVPQTYIDDEDYCWVLDLEAHLNFVPSRASLTAARRFLMSISVQVPPL